MAIKIIKNPEIYTDNPFVGSGEATPLQIRDGMTCGGRNSVTDFYQTFIPYTSKSECVSELINNYDYLCGGVFTRVRRDILVKASEDVFGSRYYFYRPKSIDFDLGIEPSIEWKREGNDSDYNTAQKKSYIDIVDDSGSIVDTSELTWCHNARKFHVFYDTIVTETIDDGGNTMHIVGNSFSDHISKDVDCVLDVVYYETGVYVLYKESNDGALKIGVYKDNTYTTVEQFIDESKNTSNAFIEVFHNRIEVYIKTEDNRVVIGELDTTDKNAEWVLLRLEDAYDGYMLAVVRVGNRWDFFFEVGTEYDLDNDGAKEIVRVLAGFTFKLNPIPLPPIEPSCNVDNSNTNTVMTHDQNTGIFTVV